jgi:hypothetical protein
LRKTGFGTIATIGTLLKTLTHVEHVVSVHRQ